MIVTDLAHAKEQIAVTPGLLKAIRFLESSEGQNLPDGRIPIDEDRVYALVQSYTTEPAGESAPRLEAHRQYIDVQYVASGVEAIPVALIDGIAVVTSYDEQHDVWFGSASADQLNILVLRAGQLAVLFPSDAHAPRQAVGAPCAVKKIVVKVAVDETA